MRSDFESLLAAPRRHKWTDAETRRIREITEAKVRLVAAISLTRQHGGDVFFSEANLRRILQLRPTEETESGDSS